MKKITNKINNNERNLVEGCNPVMQEIWLKLHNFYFNSDYKCYRIERLDRARGGLAVVVNNKTIHIA